MGSTCLLLFICVLIVWQHICIYLNVYWSAAQLLQNNQATHEIMFVFVLWNLFCKYITSETLNH